ncbi:MAG: hypothetical protein L6R35_005398 [Caloplaca aegaea]|nr:MAG: hypothetical protein L6R35_005398 [Caloplaca aegaea]
MLTLASTFKITAVSIRIRIEEDFVLRIHRGLPRDSPNTSPYFSQPPHTYDQYSISFSFIPHRTISGKSLVFGNDFEHPVRDRIPPGFDAAFGIVKWAIDPGLDGDVYADKPYLYGNALSSINILSVGPKVDEKDSLDDLTSDTGKDGVAITEGGFGGGQELREALNIPANAAARQKWFLGGHDRLENWNWEEGRVYKADFFNPYLDFNEFALKLPGFSLKVLGYLGGEDYLRHVHITASRPCCFREVTIMLRNSANSSNRYVLKEKDTGEVLFVVVFTLLPKEQVEEGEANAEQSKTLKATELGARADPEFEPKADDLD